MDKFNFLDELGEAHDEIAFLSRSALYNSALEETQDKVKALNALQGYDSQTNYGYCLTYDSIKPDFDANIDCEGEYWIHSHGFTYWLTGNESYEDLLSLFQNHIG